jgi:hypothetical protein
VGDLSPRKNFICCGADGGLFGEVKGEEADLHVGAGGVAFEGLGGGGYFFG